MNLPFTKELRIPALNAKLLDGSVIMIGLVEGGKLMTYTLAVSTLKYLSDAWFMTA